MGRAPRVKMLMNSPEVSQITRQCNLGCSLEVSTTEPHALHFHCSVTDQLPNIPPLLQPPAASTAVSITERHARWVLSVCLSVRHQGTPVSTEHVMTNNNNTSKSPLAFSCCSLPLSGRLRLHSRGLACFTIWLLGRKLKTIFFFFFLHV